MGHGIPSLTIAARGKSKPEEGQKLKSKHEEHALALSVWESEGGAPDRSGQFYQCGRRFEGDGTYTIHHLFTGETVRTGHWTMAGSLTPRMPHGHYGFSIRCKKLRIKRCATITTRSSQR